MSSSKYNNQAVEKKWQDRWIKDNLYSPDLSASDGNKFYNLFMFPYPSAEGLHAGHAFSSTGSDIYGRYMRMNGKTVFQPMGFDSFGIHPENYAIKTGEQPQTMLLRTIKHYTEQFKSLGHGYDWNRTVTTSEADYYKWTQWVFSEMFKAGLAYRKKANVNWCPSCKTVLADEQVVTPAQAGKIPPGYKTMDEIPEGLKVCERCATPAEKRDLEQWFFRITEYADRLLDNLPKINWTEKIKIAQREWIGRKEGIDITYSIEGSEEKVVCWTSRPDTNFGATFIVIAPENLLVDTITTDEQKSAVRDYVDSSLAKSKEDREAVGKQKTGVFTGRFAINDLNGARLPIWVSDFVLGGVGTGAVVGVPGHDQRDFEFAKAMKLPIIRVVVGSDNDTSDITDISQVQEDNGKMINSAFLDGLDIHEATNKIIDFLEEKGWGSHTTNYHLRDWLISRQRYWGAPIPMIHCPECAKNEIGWFDEHPATLCDEQSDWNWYGWYPDNTLPIELPYITDYKPQGTGRGPLADHPEFYKVKCPKCGADAMRETDVSDTFLDSSWYFLRYPSVGSKSSTTSPFDPEITKKWLPVDLYFGGAEHAVLHLMYARFVTMVLYDLDKIDFEEPFPHFYAHGLMIKDGAKMSKSRGNVVNPDEYVSKFGADAMRLYMMFLGPMDGYPDFRDTGIEGMSRFIGRLWDTFNTPDSNLSSESETKITRSMHATIKKVTTDIEVFNYNTAIAGIMEYVNTLREVGVTNEAKKTLALLIAPFAPHLAEEVWVELLAQPFSVHTAAWPKYDEKYLQTGSVTMAVLVNGKVRGEINIDTAKIKEEEYVVSQAKTDPGLTKWLSGGIKKTVYVPGKILNFVV